MLEFITFFANVFASITMAIDSVLGVHFAAPATPRWSDVSAPQMETTAMPPPVQMSLANAPSPQAVPSPLQLPPPVQIYAAKAPDPVPMPPPVVITIPQLYNLPQVEVSLNPDLMNDVEPPVMEK